MHLGSCEYQWAGRTPRSRLPPSGWGNWADAGFAERPRSTVRAAKQESVRKGMCPSGPYVAPGHRLTWCYCYPNPATANRISLADDVGGIAPGYEIVNARADLDVFRRDEGVCIAGRCPGPSRIDG